MPRARPPAVREERDRWFGQPAGPSDLHLRSAKALERAEVRQFVDFYMKSAPALTSEVKYVPLPAKAYEANMEHMKSKKLGTVFGGHADVGDDRRADLARSQALILILPNCLDGGLSRPGSFSPWRSRAWILKS